MRLRIAPEPALSLAALRVVVPALILVSPGFQHAREVAAFEPARRIAPEGLVWFATHVPITPAFAVAAQLVAATAAMFAIAGMRARPALAVLALSAAYLFAVSDLEGFVWHELHLLWFCAVLSVSPCDHVLAADADRPIEIEGPEYAPALWSVRLLLGAIYFFPGYHKLRALGLDWALGDNLTYQLYWKWYEHGEVPSLRLDHHPKLLAFGGLAVLAFELSFFAWMSSRRAQPFAAAAGIGFHLLTQALFRIPFASIWLCYVAVVDLRPALRGATRLARRVPMLAQRLDRAPSAESSEPRATIPIWLTTAVGVGLLSAVTIQGVRGQMQSFPFACYPTFEYKPAAAIPDLEIVRHDTRGVETLVTHARATDGYRTQRQWAEIWSLTGVTAPVSPVRLRAYYAALVRARPELGRSTVTVVFNRVDWSVRPEDRDRPPVRRIRLDSLTWTAGSRAR